MKPAFGEIIEMIDQFGVSRHIGIFMAKLKPKDDPAYTLSEISKINNSDQWHWQVFVDGKVQVFNISFWTPVILVSLE